MLKEHSIYQKLVWLLYPNQLTTASSSCPVPNELMFGSVLLVPVHMGLTQFLLHYTLLFAAIRWPAILSNWCIIMDKEQISTITLKTINLRDKCLFGQRTGIPFCPLCVSLWFTVASWETFHPTINTRSKLTGWIVIHFNCRRKELSEFCSYLHIFIVTSCH